MTDTLQEFEKYPELATIIEWFANNVPCPGSPWNKLLYEINKALAEPLPSNAGSLEQDFKELNKYLDDLYRQGASGEKDAGHLWIAFTDKFNAFRDKVLASHPSFNADQLVKQLREANPYEGMKLRQHYCYDVWKECADKAQELLNQKEG